MPRSRALPSAAAALALALLSTVTHAGEWMAGDVVPLVRACASVESVQRVVAEWESGAQWIAPPEDCRQVEPGKVLPSRLIERVSGPHVAGDVALEIWRLETPAGETVWASFAANGPHEGI